MGLAKDLTPTLGVLNSEISEVIGKAATDLLDEQFGCKAQFMGTEVIEKFNSTSEISGIVTIFQDGCQGLFLVGFNKSSIFYLLEKLYEKNFSSVDETVKEGVAEITNIIFGRFKRKLYSLGYNFKMVIPSVIIGTEHSFNLCANSQSVHKLKIGIDEKVFLEIYIALTRDDDFE